MKMENFQSGKYVKQFEYMSFSPSPIIDIPTPARFLNVSFPTASSLIHDLSDKMILAPYKKQSRTQMYVFARHMEIFMDIPPVVDGDQVQ